MEIRSILFFACSCQAQSQAVAYTLMNQADALPPGSSLVALVNLGSNIPVLTSGAFIRSRVSSGQMASLQRNIQEAHPPEELFPPMNPALKALAWIPPVVCQLSHGAQDFSDCPFLPAVGCGRRGLWRIPSSSKI